MAPETFDPYEVFLQGRTYYLLRRSSHAAVVLQGLSLQVAGLPALRKVKEYLKPTGAVLQRFGRLAVRNRIDLSKEQLVRWVRQKVAPETPEVEDGYVIVEVEGVIVGCALKVGERFIHQLPGWIRTIVQSEGFWK